MTYIPEKPTLPLQPAVESIPAQDGPSVDLQLMAKCVLDDFISPGVLSYGDLTHYLKKKGIQDEVVREQVVQTLAYDPRVQPYRERKRDYYKLISNDIDDRYFTKTRQLFEEAIRGLLPHAVQLSPDKPHIDRRAINSYVTDRLIYEDELRQHPKSAAHIIAQLIDASAAVRRVGPERSTVLIDKEGVERGQIVSFGLRGSLTFPAPVQRKAPWLRDKAGLSKNRNLSQTENTPNIAVTPEEKALETIKKFGPKLIVGYPEIKAHMRAGGKSIKRTARALLNNLQVVPMGSYLRDEDPRTKPEPRALLFMTNEQHVKRYFALEALYGAAIEALREEQKPTALVSRLYIKAGKISNDYGWAWNPNTQAALYRMLCSDPSTGFEQQANKMGRPLTKITFLPLSNNVESYRQRMEALGGKASEMLDEAALSISADHLFTQVEARHGALSDLDKKLLVAGLIARGDCSWPPDGDAPILTVHKTATPPVRYKAHKYDKWREAKLY